MKKHLYEIQRSKLPSYLKWWLIKYKHAGVLSEVLENLTSPITLQDSLRRKFKIFQIGGNSVQDGTPSPETPVPIQNVTGDVEVKVENKNLYTGNIVNLGISSSSIGYALSYGTDLRGTYIKCKPNQNFSISRKDISNNRFRLGFTKEEPHSGIEIHDYKNYDTILKVENIIVPENVNYLFIYLSNDGTLPVDFMIQEGTTVTNYIEHEEQNVNFPLSEGQVLHEEDTIEEKIVQRRSTIVFDGSEAWNRNTNYPNILGLYVGISSYLQARGINVKCNVAKFNINAGSNNSTIFNICRLSNSFTSFIIDLDILKFPNIASWKAYLSEQYANGTPVTIEYELAEPIEISFTEAQRTAKAQIDKLFSYKGTTHITSSNDPSPKFKIQYVKEE